MVVVVSDVDVARPVHRYSAGPVQFRLDCRTAVPTEASHASSCDRCNDARPVDPAYPVVAPIGDVDVARPIHRYSAGPVQFRLDCRTAVPTEASHASSCDRCNDARPVDPAYPVVAPIGDVDVARPIHRHSCGPVQIRLDRRTTVRTRTGFTGSRDRRNDARSVDPAYPVVAPIGDVDVARPIHRHSSRPVQIGLDCRTAVSVGGSGRGARNCGDGEFLSATRRR